MTVGELEELLAVLPDDMTVCVSGGNGARHITIVDKTNRRRADEFSRAFGGDQATVDGYFPAQLILRAEDTAPLWMLAFGDQVDYRLSGRWPDRVYESPPVAAVPVHQQED